MANGFFLGGAAEGIMESRKAGLAEQTQNQDVALRTRALDINEKQFAAEQGRKDTSKIDENIASTMTIVSDVIKAGIEGGKPPAQIEAAIQPLIKSAQMLAQKAGRDPNAIAAQAKAQLLSPTPVERAAVAGAATATQAVTQANTEAKLLEQPGGSGELPRRYKDIKDKTTLENSLRDDYVKQTANFVTMRDAKSRLDTIEKTGAGDMALVFQYMKLLDPTSTVREGEYASASNAAGIPSAVQGLYNKMIGGGVLDEKARTQIKSQAGKFYERAAAQHDKLTTNFANIAKRQGLNANNVVVDLTAPASPAAQAEGVTPGGTRFRVLP